MTARDFIYWLRGFLEMTSPETLTKQQLEIINDHLEKAMGTESVVLSGDIRTDYVVGGKIC